MVVGETHHFRKPPYNDPSMIPKDPFYPKPSQLGPQLMARIVARCPSLHMTSLGLNEMKNRFGA